MSLFDSSLNMELNFRRGKNAQDNWTIIDESKPNDLWFHLADYPSSHLVLSLPEGKTYRDLSKQTIVHCASECKKRSKYSLMKKVKITYTEIKELLKGDSIGSVLVNQSKNITL